MRALFASLALFAFAAPANAQDAVADAVAEAPAERPVVAAMFYSGFCGACRILEPRIEAIMPAFEDRSVTFVEFNQTWSAFNGASLTRLAETHQISDVWENRRGGTGFMVIVDPASGRELDIITVRDSEADIYQRIDEALSS